MSSTIARWLKSLLEVAGIDTLVFSAHSVRGVSSSAAANLGILQMRSLRQQIGVHNQSFRGFVTNQ